MEKLEALAKHLDCDVDDIIEIVEDNHYGCGSREYLVYTDAEADEAASEYIRDSLWAFNSEFVSAHTRNGLNAKAVESLRKAQGELCEDANDLVQALIGDLDHFVADAIALRWSRAFSRGIRW